MDVDPVFQEFVDVLNALAGAHAFALQGIGKARKYWEDELAEAKPPTTADSTVYITNGPHDAPWTIAYSKWRLGDLPHLLGGGGAVMTRVSQQWVISVFAEWDEHYRGRISHAMGLSEPLKLPPFGDLRLFRHDIVHNRGYASAANSGKAEVFTDWFQQGESMFFDTFKVAEFMAAVKVGESLAAQGQDATE
jgi:hypothetical protein